MLIFYQKHFWFCITPLKIPQPVLPYWFQLHISNLFHVISNRLSFQTNYHLEYNLPIVPYLPIHYFDVPLYRFWPHCISISHEWKSWWVSYKHSQTKFMAHWGNQKCFASIYELFWNVIQSKNVQGRRKVWKSGCWECLE